MMLESKHSEDMDDIEHREPFLALSQDTMALYSQRSFDSVNQTKKASYFKRARLYGFIAILLTILLYTNQTSTNSSSTIVKSTSENAINDITSDYEIHHNSAFSGAFSRFPLVSELPDRYKRLTVIAHWLHDDVDPILRTFLNTAQENADSIDLLFINRIIDSNRSCVNFKEAGIDITWGGNVKHVCMEQQEWQRRLTDFLCDKSYGWACTNEQRKEVALNVLKRPDKRGYEWKPFRGPMYQDLFINPENPLWAWSDVDNILGDLRHFPFSLLSNLSFVVLDRGSVDEATLFGQMVGWNMDDTNLLSCWKKIPTLRTADHMTKGLEGPHLQTNEEQEWGFRYLNVEEGFPGEQLSFAQLADANADDFFYHKLNKDRTQAEMDNLQFILSGRDVLFSHRKLDRKSIEELIMMERGSKVSDIGWYKWSTGYDGSDLMLLDPKLTQIQAYLQSKGPHSPEILYNNHFRGELETIQYRKGAEECPAGDWIKSHWRICYPPHPLSFIESSGPILRSSFVHFKEQKAGYLFQRREIDNSIRGYARYLFKHSLFSKKKEWGQMPSFDLSREHILTISNGLLQVWKMGKDRNITLFQGGESNL